ncbi:MAG: hypothetical protein ACK5NG_06395 [Chthoniobacterales bacterium]
MRIEPQADGALQILEVPLHLAELFRQITHCSELSSSDAEDRLFPSPVSGKPQNSKIKAGIISDWKAFVQPGLDEHFRSHRSIVESDIQRMETKQGTFSITIPFSHIDAWIGTLIQARLAIVAAHNLEEKDIARDEVTHIESKRDLAILRIHFYGSILQSLIEETETD